MNALSAVAYASDAWVLGTYFLMTRGKPARWFHFANALGAAPLLVIEVAQRAWPVLPLTVAFCAIGWLGLWQTRRRPRPAAEGYRWAA